MKWTYSTHEKNDMPTDFGRKTSKENSTFKRDQVVTGENI